MRTQFRTIYRRWLHHQPCPCLCLPPQSTVALDRSTARVSSRVSSALRTIRFCTSVLPSWRQVDWSAVRNSSCPLITATRCPVMTHRAVQLLEAVFVGSGRFRPACFIGRWLTHLTGVPSPRPWKRSQMKASRSACCTEPKMPLMPG